MLYIIFDTIVYVWYEAYIKLTTFKLEILQERNIVQRAS